ncbi:MAG TPA: MMPL family transporter [Geobacteraceae bacterium]|nr:MMPL family transporter [Geobacteraceae bacterium]
MKSTTGKGRGLFDLIARYPLAILFVALLLSAISVVYTKNNLEFLTGRDDLMPKNSKFHRDYRDYRREFGDTEEIVVVLESDDPDKAGRFGKELFSRLQQRKDVLREVFYPYGLPFFQKNGLLFLPLEDVEALRNNLTKAMPLLKDLAAAPSVQTLFTSLTTRMDEYMRQQPGAPGAEEQVTSLTFMLDKLGAGFERFSKPGGGAFSLDDFFLGSGKDGTGSRFVEAGKMQILTVLPVKESGSFVPAEKAIAAVRDEIRKVAADSRFAGVKAGLTGVPVLEYEEMSTSQRDIALATVISIVLTVILLLFAFRGVANAFAAMISLLVAIALSFGMATLTVGHLNILSMVFAVMLIGIGIEYGIQIVLRYQEEIRAGRQRLESLRIALNRNLWAITMAAATVAAAFLTFVFTDFKGISELGIIAAIGIAICVLVTFTVLPAMLVIPVKYGKKNRRVGTRDASSSLSAGDDSPASGLARSIKAVLFDHPKTVLFLTGLLCIASLYPLSRIDFDYNLMNLQAKGLESVSYAYKLMKSSENSGYFAVASARTPEEAAARAKALEALPTVDHVVTIASFIPEEQERKLAELASLRSQMAGVRPVPYDEDLRVMELPVVFETFRTTVERFVQRLERENRPEAKDAAAFLATLDRFFAGLEKEKDRNAVGMLRDFQGNLLAGLPEKLETLRNSLAVTPVVAADIPEELRKRFVGTTGRYLLQIAPKGEIFDRKPLEAFLKDVRTIEPNATGEPVMVFESMTIMRDSYRGAFVYAFLAIVLILLVTFRSVRYALIGLVPLVVGVLFMVSGMWLAGIRFNSANIIVMPLVLGIAVDSGIYIINRFRREGESGYRVIASSTGRGVIYNTLTIMISFGALMVAGHQGVFSIGAVMSLGMVACQIAFIVTLPAVLAVFGEKRGDAA